ncbi:MAG TPA: type II CAAX endopeptidase family protein [Edaphobacter sp.]|nr:type II CAAX endopeptidase family protein [Edaphobacter sp.]
MVVVQAVLIGMLVMIAGTIPRNTIFAANLRYYPNIPWAIPLTAAYLWLFWRYLQGAGPPESTIEQRRQSLRANRISVRVWAWALLAGGLGIVALVIALSVANRLVVLPEQQLPDLTHVPKFTVLSLLLMAAPVAGIVEEAAFRGYMQGSIERRHGLVIAILVTGTMFAIAHLDFTLILLPYYVAVAAIYGVVTHLTESILPAIVLHTGGNLYSNLDLWLHGKAEWQASADATKLIWKTGADSSFWATILGLLVVSTAMLWAYRRLARIARDRFVKS